MAKDSFLIGAHGLFWQRSEIDWDAGPGRTYQLLGHRGVKSGTLEVCDFRRARGIYILFNDYGPTYVGRARGANDGFGYRLKSHHRDKGKDWTRFSWFSFDSVRRIPKDLHWAEVIQDEKGRAVTAASAIDELEALMITTFGLHNSQNKMRLPEARKPWKQLTLEDCFGNGVARKVSRERIRMDSLRHALAYDDDI